MAKTLFEGIVTFFLCFIASYIGISTIILIVTNPLATSVDKNTIQQIGIALGLVSPGMLTGIRIILSVLCGFYGAIYEK